MNQTRWAGQPGTLVAARDLPGTALVCSSQVNWQSILLRRYVAHNDLDEYLVPPIADQRVVLIERAGDNNGRPNLDVGDGRHWTRAKYRDGDLSLLAPGRSRRIRWHTTTPHIMVHLYLPASLLGSAAAELTRRAECSHLTRTQSHDRTLVAIVHALARAVEHGYGEHYACTAATFLAAHLLVSRGATLRPAERNAIALRRIDELLRERLSSTVNNTDIAHEIGRNPFQLIRMCRAAWGETPIQRLTRMRIEHARVLLQETTDSIIEIAAQCGYQNPSHFATAFKRRTGLSPTQYRAE